MLLPQTHSPEVDNSLFMAVMMVLMLERMEKRHGATPAAFPPSNLRWNNLYFCVS
jgi:hypothetical protein